MGKHCIIFVVCPFSKVLQHILNPAFLHSFEKGEGEQLLGPPNPEGDNPDSITSVFITKVAMFADILLSGFAVSCLFFCFSSLSNVIHLTLFVGTFPNAHIRPTIYIFHHYQLHSIQFKLSFPISAVHRIATVVVSSSFFHFIFCLPSVFFFSPSHHPCDPSFTSHFIHQIRL